MPTWYATTSLVSNYQEMSETSPGTDATSAVGWVQGTTATGRDELDAGAKPTGGFSGTADPDGVLDGTRGDALRTTSPYIGTFATGTWTLNFVVIGVTQTGAVDGRAYFRLLRSPNADGSAATEITSGQIQCSQITNLSTTAVNSTATTSPITSFTVDNEYVFCQIAWEATGPGGMTTSDVVMRVGTTATRLVSPTFTAAPTTNTDVRVSFPTPTSSPSTGAGMQEFRALVRKKASAFTGNPTCAIELWENGSLKSTRLSATPVSSTSGTVLSGLWDATDLTTASGASVECKVVGTGSVGGSLEVGAIEWNKYPEDPSGPVLVGRGSGKATARATLSVSYPLTGRASGKAADRATLSAAYPLSGRSTGQASARSTLTANYALIGRSSGRGTARSNAPSVSFALSGRTSGGATATSWSPAVAYPLSGRATGRARARAATAAAEYALVGVSSGKSSARSSVPSISYAFAGASRARSASRAQLGVLYPLIGRATGRSKAFYIPSGTTTDVRVGFDIPTSQLVAGTGLQEFRVEVRKTVGSGIPSARIELWESGSFVATLLDNTDITDETTQIISVSWDAALLSDISGAGVECRVVGEPDEAGGTATVEIGAIEWNAFTANPQFALLGRAVSGSSSYAAASLGMAAVGRSQVRSSARASLSVSYALSGQASGKSSARSVATASYALVGRATGTAGSRSTVPAVAYPLTGRARGTASGRSAVSTISYVLTGRGSGKSQARAAATPPGAFALLGRSAGRSSARSNRLVISHALVGTLLAQGVPTGTIEVQRKLTGMMGLEGHYAATVEVQRKLAGSLYASATLIGVLEDVIVGVRLTGTLSATAIPQGKLEVSRKLQGVLRGNGTMAAELTVARLEALYPELILSMTGYTGSVSDLRNDPDDVTDDTWIMVEQ